ncbi:UNVERIFIED_CONTAM: hypothetical protein HHA_215343 [Hammondia hammondi]|eukprot:XP_008886666.1 hypothetical protein HHA_215343 [Hammondia hammondi]
MAQNIKGYRASEDLVGGCSTLEASIPPIPNAKTGDSSSMNFSSASSLTQQRRTYMSPESGDAAGLSPRIHNGILTDVRARTSAFEQHAVAASSHTATDTRNFLFGPLNCQDCSPIAAADEVEGSRPPLSTVLPKNYHVSNTTGSLAAPTKRLQLQLLLSVPASSADGSIPAGSASLHPTGEGPSLAFSGNCIAEPRILQQRLRVSPLEQPRDSFPNSASIHSTVSVKRQADTSRDQHSTEGQQQQKPRLGLSGGRPAAVAASSNQLSREENSEMETQPLHPKHLQLGEKTTLHLCEGSKSTTADDMHAASTKAAETQLAAAASSESSSSVLATRDLNRLPSNSVLARVDGVSLSIVPSRVEQASASVSNAERDQSIGTRAPAGGELQPGISGAGPIHTANSLHFRGAGPSPASVEQSPCVFQEGADQHRTQRSTVDRVRDLRFPAIGPNAAAAHHQAATDQLHLPALSESSSWDPSSLQLRCLLASSLRKIFKLLIKRVRRNQRRAMDEASVVTHTADSSCVQVPKTGRINSTSGNSSGVELQHGMDMTATLPQPETRENYERNANEQVQNLRESANCSETTEDTLSTSGGLPLSGNLAIHSHQKMGQEDLTTSGKQDRTHSAREASPSWPGTHSPNACENASSRSSLMPVEAPNPGSPAGDILSQLETASSQSDDQPQLAEPAAPQNPTRPSLLPSFDKLTEEKDERLRSSAFSSPVSALVCEETTTQMTRESRGGHRVNLEQHICLAEQQLLAAYRECFLLLAAAQRKEELHVFEFVLFGGSLEGRVCGDDVSKRSGSAARPTETVINQGGTRSQADGKQSSHFEDQLNAAKAQLHASPDGMQFPDASGCPDGDKLKTQGGTHAHNRDATINGEAQTAPSHDYTLDREDGKLRVNTHCMDNKAYTNIQPCVLFRLAVTEASARTVRIDVIAFSLHFVLAALDGLRDAWREGSRNTKARVQILESILTPLCLQQRCRGSYLPFRMPQALVIQHQALLGLQLLGLLPATCPSPSPLSSLVSHGTLMKPSFAGTASAASEAAGTASLSATAEAQASARGIGLAPIPSTGWLVPPFSNPAAVHSGGGQISVSGNEGSVCRDASLVHPSVLGGPTECCCCCCGYGQVRLDPVPAAATQSSTEDSGTFPGRNDHSQHRPGGRLQQSPRDRTYSTSERAASIRGPVQTGNSGKSCGNGSVKDGACGGYDGAGEAGGGGQTVSTGGGKQKRGRYRTVAVVAEEGDAADIYKKPRPAVTSRRVLLQRQLQQHAITGATPGAEQLSTNGTCAMPSVTSMTPSAQNDISEQSVAASCSQHLAELETGETDDNFMEQNEEVTSMSVSVSSTPTPGSAPVPRGDEGGGSGEQPPQQSALSRNATPVVGARMTVGNDKSSTAVEDAAAGRTAETNPEHSPSHMSSPHLQQSGAAAAPAAGTSQQSGKQASAGGACASMTMKSTRHNKTKQPGVFQFTRGIKRFWAASWYADGHPGWKAFSVEKWGNSEALKRARKAYEEKVPHGATALKTCNLGIDETETGGQTSVTPPSGAEVAKGSETSQQSTFTVSDTSQPKQSANTWKESQSHPDRAVTLQASNTSRVSNGRRKQQQNQSGAAVVESTFDQRGTDLTSIHRRSAGVSFGSSRGIFSGDTGMQTDQCVAPAQRQQQLRGEDFIQSFWEDFDSNDSQDLGSGGILSLEGSSGRYSTSSCYDSSSSSGFYLRSFSYSARPDSWGCSDGQKGHAGDGHKHQTNNFFGESGADHGTMLGGSHSSRHDFEEDELSLLSPSQFFLGSENDDITGKLLLSGPDADTPTPY